MSAAAQLEAACRALEADGGPRIECRVGPVAESLAEPTFVGPAFEVGDRRFLLRVPNGLRIFIEDGASVTIDRPDHLSADNELLWLLGSGWGALAYQRGVLPLHLSAVELPDGGVAGFGGPSGAGKSTLAAALGQRDFTLFADDVTAIAWNEGEAVALPGHKTLKLWGDAVEMIGAAADRPVRTDEAIDKYYIEGDPTPRAPSPLARLYVLKQRHGLPEGAPTINISRTTGGHSVQTLREAIYRPRFGEEIMGRRAMFEALAAVAGHVAVFEFGRPKDKARFVHGVDTLVDHLRADVERNDAPPT